MTGQNKASQDLARFWKSIHAELSDIVVLLAEYKYSQKALYVAQECLINLIIDSNRLIKTLREERGSLIRRATKQAVESKQQGTLTNAIKKKTRSLYESADKYLLEIEKLQDTRWLIRYIGDGIAWHALGFNRSLIRAIGSKEKVGIPHTDDLLRYRKVAREIRWSTGRYALPLIHDLTNCLRTDDLSIVAGGQIYSAELKLTSDGKPRSAEDNRSKRQKSRGQKIQRYLDTGEMGELFPTWKGGKLFRSEVLQYHNFIAIAEALSEARKSGFGIVRPEKAVMYIAVPPNQSITDKAIRRASEIYPDFYKSLVTFRSISPRVDDYHDALPITSMELSPEDILDIIFNRYGIVVVMNFELLKEQFADRGIDLKISHLENGAMQFVVETNPKIDLQQGTWNKVLLEGFSIRTLIEQVRELQTKALQYL